MKKIIFVLIALLTVTLSLHAQDAEKEFKNAKKTLGAYNLDPTNNKGKLSEARTSIDIATTEENIGGLKNKVAALLIRGEIYNEIATKWIAIKQLGIGSVDDLPKADSPALEAGKAFTTALDLAEKKYEIKDAINGLQQAQGNLSNMGIFKYEDQEFGSAFESFKEVLNVHKVLQSKKEKSALDLQEDYHQQLYIAGLAALNAKKEIEAKPFFEELYENNFDKPAIFEALYKIHAGGVAFDEENQEEKLQTAYKYLEAGREKHPDDVSLLFAEINHFLRIGQMEALIEKLIKAIEKEPDNISLYTTLGNVYDNLYQKEVEMNNTEKAADLFDKAKTYYDLSLSKNPKHFDSVYSLGALFYNKAAAMTKDLNSLSDDYSKEGLRKYDEMKAKVFKEFDNALPFFKKAESMNPNDINTLLALREIFARKDDLATSNIFKERLEKVQAGGTNEKPYFNE